MRFLLCLILLAFSQNISIAKPQTPAPLQNGIWRATIHRDGQALPIILEIKSNPDSKTFSAFVHNGEEKLKMDTVYFDKDSLHIPMRMFDAEIVAKVASANKLSGTYYRFRDNKAIGGIPFNAEFGKNYKFFPKGVAKTTKSVDGKFDVEFKNESTGAKSQAVGNFVQNGSDVKGSFLTPTGDYRFLTGSLNGDSLYLSTFDGSNAMLFKAALQPDGSLKGSLWSGLAAYRTWNAKRNPDAKLPDATKLTFLKPGYDDVNFKFTDTDGEVVSLDDARYKDKVVILQIMGSWCPNCMDETNFLQPWYKKNKQRGVEIIGLSFEKSADPAISNPKIKKMVARLGIEYPVVLAGTNTDTGTAEALPMLNKVMSYPTTIFIDRKGKVREIHTGFSGPGTGKFYDEFIKEFTALTDGLIDEKGI